MRSGSGIKIQSVEFAVASVQSGLSMAMVPRLFPCAGDMVAASVATIAGSDIGATISPLAEVTVEWLTVKPPVRDVSL